MKKGTRLLCLFISVAILAVLGAVSAFAEPDQIEVSLRIEGVHANLYYKAVTLTVEGDPLTVQDLLTYVDETEAEVTITGASTGYVTAVNGEASAQTQTGWDGWMFRLNGVAPATGIDSTLIADGDEVVLYYSDEFVTGMQYPEMDVSHLNTNGEIVFTSLDTTYDAQWNPIVERCPVAGMTVTVGTVEYVTDAEGKITLDAEQRNKTANLPLSVSRETDGIPTVLRLAPNTTIHVNKVINPNTGDDLFVTALVSVLAMAASLSAAAYVIRKAYCR